MNSSQDLLVTLQRNARSELARLGARAKGQFGVSALHLGTGMSLAVGEDAMYPPCSAVKMPLAVALLDKVDRGELRLSDMVEVRQSEMNPVGIGEDFPHAGIALSVANLLEATITRSCNTSTDVLFRLIGGPPEVTAWLQRAGIGDFSVARTMRVALGVLHEIPLPPDHVSMRDHLRVQSQDVLDARNRPNAAFHHDQRDLCTPRAMLTLLERLWTGELLKPASRNLLLDVMSRTSTGAHRIRAGLPQGVPFASKSGSGAGAAVDVGFMTLPEGRGCVALGAFVMASPLTMPEREAVLADVGRLLCDYFVLASPAA